VVLGPQQALGHLSLLLYPENLGYLADQTVRRLHVCPEDQVILLVLKVQADHWLQLDQVDLLDPWVLQFLMRQADQLDQLVLYLHEVLQVLEDQLNL